MQFHDNQLICIYKHKEISQINKKKESNFLNDPMFEMSTPQKEICEWSIIKA